MMVAVFPRILLATEHTEFDVGAERMAFALARDAGATLAAVVPLVSNVEYESVAPALAAEAESVALTRSVGVRAAAVAAGLAIEVRVRRAEEPWRAVLAEARDWRADLVVVRRRGRRGFLANLMVGEMPDKLATTAPCHVLIVPRAVALARRRVLAGIDPAHAAPEVARLAARMAVARGIPLTLASVASDGSRSALDEAAAVAAEAAQVAAREGAVVDTKVAHGRVAEAIAAMTAAADADLVVLGRGTHERRLRLGGNAHRIVGLVACAVLVVKP